MSMTRALSAGRLVGAAIALCLACGVAPSRADAPAVPSESLAVNLVELLVKQGVISRTAADLLLKQAEQETAQAQAQAQSQALLQSPPRTASAGATPLASGDAAPTAVAALPPAAPGVVRVPYIPQVVRDQIRDEVKGEVMQQAKAEGWAQPGALPDWIDRIKISGDVRLRAQYDLYSKTNTNELIDFATFNNSGPTDINDLTNPNGLPFLNTRRDQYNLATIRARLAIDAKLSDSLGAGIRLATGEDQGPASTTAYLGGGLGKKNFWLDRAFIWIKPMDGLTLTGGRMANPFQSTDLLYSDDLNFDGFNGKYVYALPRRDLKVSILGGGFPINFQSQTFPTDSTDKSAERAKWLFAGQASIEWDPVAFDWKTSLAVYDFSDVRGVLSSSCALYNGNKQCSTDSTRATFLGKGNTLFFIRNIAPNPATPLNYAQPQYLGLRFGYDLLNLTTQFDYRLDMSHHLVFTGDYVRNLAYSAGEVCHNAPNGLPVNNLSPSASGNTDPCDAPPSGDTKARFRSGPNAWLVKLLYGTPDPTRFGEWNVTAGYRYIQPDALMDGFNSVDFDLGGTNAKGYTLTGTLGLYSGAYLQARWFSATEVYGAPLSIDVGQLELHVRF